MVSPDRKCHKYTRKSIISLQMELKVQKLCQNLIDDKPEDIKMKHWNLINSEDLKTTTKIHAII